MEPELERICGRVAALSTTVGKFILQERKNFKAESIEIKGHNDLVSYVDRTAERMIVEGLKNLIPEAGFITEENTDSKKGKRFNWIIDPLDGTTNFIHGVPCFCISIALTDGDEVVVGVVNELNLAECFYAWKDGGAFLNGRKINVSDISKLSDALLATGFPYYDYGKMEPYMKVFDHLMRNTHGQRRLGSAAADLAWTAAGRFEAFYEYGLHAWDVAAGALLIQEAGGIVTDFKGGKDFVFGAEMIAGNKPVSAELLTIINGHFYAGEKI